MSSLLKLCYFGNKLRHHDSKKKKQKRDFIPNYGMRSNGVPLKSLNYFDLIFKKESNQDYDTFFKSKNIFWKVLKRIRGCKAKVIPGGYCSDNNECSSGICKNGICFASEECKILKHDGDRFDIDKVNLVFIGSAFESIDAWEEQVQNTYSLFSAYNMFSDVNKQFNAFFVSSIHPTFCDFGCSGIDRLLCCNVAQAKDIANQCFPSGTHQQAVVIHNSEKYGGAGYKNSNVATTSTHRDGSYVAIHELGHSLFELVDEYEYGGGDSLGPNCDTKECNKWDDLMNQPDLMSKYESVSCVPGCQGNNYFVGQNSFMDKIKLPVGAINERYTCCTYLNLTGKYPSYCEVFNFWPGALDSFCGLDFQHYLTPPPATGPDDLISAPHQNGFISVQEPLQVTILLEDDEPTISKIKHMPTGLFSTREVNGDYHEMSHAVMLGIEMVVQVTITYSSGSVNTLFFNSQMTVYIPPEETLSIPPVEAIVEHTKRDIVDVFTPYRISVEGNILFVVCEHGTSVTDVTASYVQTF